MESINTLVTIRSILYPKGSMGGCWGIVMAEEVSNDIYFRPRAFILKGELPSIDFGQTYKVMAEPMQDKYGDAYEIKLLFPYTDFNNNESAKSFLLSILTENQVSQLYSCLENPIKTISEHDIDKLCSVKGIKNVTAQIIINKYEDNKIYQEAFADLFKYGLSMTMLKKIIKYYGNINKAVNIIHENPYEMAGQVEGIGFLIADEIGKKMGIEGDDIRRIKGYIRWYLNDMAYSGCSWVSPGVLCESATALLGLESTSSLKVALKELFNDHIIFWDDSKSFVCLRYYYDLEQKICNELLRLQNTKREFRSKDFEDILKQTESTKGYSFTEEQISGAKMILDNPVSVLTGRAGSGKTTSVQIALDCLKPFNFIGAAALSGKASSRLMEATGFQASTIHRLLEYNPQYNAFMRNETSPLAQDVIFIDECSFLDENLFYNLLKAMKSGSKLILIGDTNQLEPLGVGNLFSDIIKSKRFPHTNLNKIHRQAAKSGIISEAYKISKGEQIVDSDFSGAKTFGDLKDFHLIKSNNIDCNFILEIFKKEYEKYHDIMRVQCLSPVKTRGDTSVQKINNAIQGWYNPETVRGKYYEFYRNGEKVKIKIGDKVLNTSNNYSTTNLNNEASPIYNGFTGIVTDIDTKNGIMLVDFGNNVGTVVINRDSFDSIELGYALTVHKSQGSEWKSVIIVLNISSYSLLTRNLVYTAVTRAQNNCFLCTDNKALKTAIGTEIISRKQTFLKNMLETKDTMGGGANES